MGGGGRGWGAPLNTGPRPRGGPRRSAHLWVPPVPLQRSGARDRARGQWEVAQIPPLCSRKDCRLGLCQRSQTEGKTVWRQKLTSNSIPGPTVPCSAPERSGMTRPLQPPTLEESSDGSPLALARPVLKSYQGPPDILRPGNERVTRRRGAVRRKEDGQAAAGVGMERGWPARPDPRRRHPKPGTWPYDLMTRSHQGLLTIVDEEKYFALFPSEFLAETPCNKKLTRKNPTSVKCALRLYVGNTRENRKT